MFTIYFLKMSPPRTCLRPACHDFKVPWTVPSFSEYFILISSKLFVLNNCVLKCNILVHSSQMIAAQGQEQSSSCSYFKKQNIIAKTKNWHAIYCLFISDSCFQLLHPDRKFWPHRYFFLHLCTHISDNTGYPKKEIFLPDREKKSFKELIAITGPVEPYAKMCAGDNSRSYWINRISLFPVPLNTKTRRDLSRVLQTFLCLVNCEIAATRCSTQAEVLKSWPTSPGRGPTSW